MKKTYIILEKKDRKEIKDWIFEQNPIKNRETIKDIKEKGQQTPGLITADGLIINGNRRFTLIQKIYDETKETTKFANFRTVILDEVFLIWSPKNTRVRK